MDPQPDYFVVWPHNHILSSPESWTFLQVIVVVAAKKALDIFFAGVWWMRERHIYIYRERERGCVGCFFVAAQLTLFSLRLRRQKLRYAATFDQLRSDSYCMRLWWIGARTHRLSKHSCYIYTLAVRRSDFTKAVSYIKTSDWPELGAKPTVRLLKKLQIIFLILTLCWCNQTSVFQSVSVSSVIIVLVVE